MCKKFNKFLLKVIILLNKFSKIPKKVWAFPKVKLVEFLGTNSQISKSKTTWVELPQIYLQKVSLKLPRPYLELHRQLKILLQKLRKKTRRNWEIWSKKLAKVPRKWIPVLPKIGTNISRNCHIGLNQCSVKIGHHNRCFCRLRKKLHQK